MRVRAPGGVRYRLRRANWQAARRRGIERRAPCRPVEGGHRLPGLLPDLVTDSFFIAFGSGIAAVTRALMSTEVASQSKCQSPDISTIASLRTARKHLEASYTSGVASAAPRRRSAYRSGEPLSYTKSPVVPGWLSSAASAVARIARVSAVPPASPMLPLAAVTWASRSAFHHENKIAYITGLICAHRIAPSRLT
jgi:hypothetical protein